MCQIDFQELFQEVVEIYNGISNKTKIYVKCRSETGKYSIHVSEKVQRIVYKEPSSFNRSDEKLSVEYLEQEPRGAVSTGGGVIC